MYNNIIQSISYGRNNSQLPRIENFKLDDTQPDLTSFAFSGTDSGLVTIPETAKLSLDQFKFHIYITDSQLLTEGSLSQLIFVYTEYNISADPTRFEVSTERDHVLQVCKTFQSPCVRN